MMIKYIAKRLLLIIFLMMAVSTVTFFLIHLVPGDPVMSILGEGADNREVLRLRKELKLDRSILEQYLEFNKNLLNLSFGKSIFDGEKVGDNILVYLPNTFYLAVSAMILALLISFPLGALAALRENKILDSAVTIGSSAVLALPNFFLGPLLIIFFSLELGLLPVSGCETPAHIVLPAMTLGISMSAVLTPIVRVSIGVELEKNYVLMARARGFSEWKIFSGHLLKNSMIPIVTTAGMQLGALMTGTIVTETIFSWQGLGILLVKSIQRRDYPMVQGVTVFITFVYLFLNFLVDLSYFVLDPRIRYELEKK